jgi:ketosteroid isomerase-like protein
MSQENVETVRRALSALDEGNFDEAVADVAPDVEYVTSGTIPGLGGTFRGPEGVKRFSRWIRDEFDDARLQVQEIIDVGDRVMVSLIASGRGKQSGVEASWNIWQVWTLRGGKVVSGEGFVSREDALQAAGLTG